MIWFYTIPLILFFCLWGIYHNTPKEQKHYAIYFAIICVFLVAYFTLYKTMDMRDRITKLEIYSEIPKKEKTDFFQVDRNSDAMQVAIFLLNQKIDKILENQNKGRK